MNNARPFRDHFVTVTGWMVTELKLKGTELIVFALINGYSQDGQSEFYGTMDYIDLWLQGSRTNTARAVKKLVGYGIVTKRKIKGKNKYKINPEGIKQMAKEIKEKYHFGTKKKEYQNGTKESTETVLKEYQNGTQISTKMVPYNKGKEKDTKIDSKGTPKKNEVVNFLLYTNAGPVSHNLKNLTKQIGIKHVKLLVDFFKADEGDAPWEALPFTEKMADAIINWLEHRREIKKYVKLKGFKMMLNKFAQMDEPFCCALIENAIMNNYTGCVFPNTLTKYKNQKGNGIKQQQKRNGGFSDGYLEQLAADAETI